MFCKRFVSSFYIYSLPVVYKLRNPVKIVSNILTYTAQRSRRLPAGSGAEPQPKSNLVHC